MTGNSLAVIVLTAYWGIVSGCRADDAGRLSRAATIAVLPFANYSGSAKSEIMGDSLIYRILQDQGWDVIPRDFLRDVLRKHRIRARSGVSGDQVSTVGRELSARFFLFGSYDIYIEKDIPEVGVSIMVIDADKRRILSARSDAASGEDFAGLLGIGRMSSIDELFAKVVSSSLAGYTPARIDSLTAEAGKEFRGRVAVVPFDNLSSERYAGQVVSSILVSELIVSGWDVALPGDVFHLFRANNRIPHGEIDIDLASQLENRLGAVGVITGSVLNFVPGVAGVDGSTAEVEINCRLIDSGTGRILSTACVDSKGSDSESLFRSGTCYSLGNLARKTITNLIEKLTEERIANLARTR